MTLRRILAAALLAVAGSAAAAAGPLLHDYRHTAWTANEGAPAQIAALAQTPDGWLWLGTADGLYRFDGVTFEDVPLPPRGMLSRAQVIFLHAAPNGDLWIAYPYGGLAVRHSDGRIEDIAEPAGASTGPIDGMAIDRHGVLWAVSNNGLYQLAPANAAAGLRRVVDGAAWSKSAMRSVRVARDGTLWATFDNRVWRQDPASGALVAAGPGGSLAQAPDGRMWAQRGAALVQVGAATSGALAEAPWSESYAAALFDHDGNLWQLAMPRGVCRLATAMVHGGLVDAARSGECIADAARISSGDTEQLLEDREGNIWIATQLGLDRYQPNRVRQSGLAGSGTPISLAADADGVVWAANASDGALWRLDPHSAPVLQAGRYARVVGTARDGALLLAGKRTIERRLHGTVTQIPLPPGRDGKSADLNVLGTLDDGKVLWMASLETGLMGLVNGVWQTRSFFHLPPKIVISAAGAPGQLWIADGDGGLTRYDDGKLTRIDATSAGLATAVFASPDVMVAGERGLAVLQHGTMRLLRSDADDALRNISGMVMTPDGDHWFNGIHGVVHIRAADWQYAMAHPDARLRTSLEGGRDGYAGQATILNRLPSAVQGGGQLWFAATGGVVRIDPSTLRDNPVALSVQISHVATPLGAYPVAAAAAGTVHLPPASGSIGIAFTTPALRRPEQVHYSWRLDGVDRAWVDGGNRHVANYSNLGPGRYQFRVRATNEDGVPGAAEAVQAFVIAPTLVQTAWFRALCVLAVLLLGVALYRYRIRVLTARLSVQLQVRASERERIARTLHDTYLQSVHALLLRVGALAQSLPAAHPLRARLDALLADASDAVVEGRGQVEQLRTGSPAALAYALEDTIENVLARAAGPLRQCYPGVAYALQVTGARRALTAKALNEAGQIAAEALRNAFIHAGASQIDVTVDYGAVFSVQVQDDGKGLDNSVRIAGYRSGHWGLLGMRERARDLGAALMLDGQPGHGTAILLRVPGERAYAPAPRPRWWARWRRG